MRNGWVLAAAALAVLTACGGDDDVGRLCRAEAGAHASAVSDEPGVRRWIERHMRTRRGRAVASELFEVPPTDRVHVLRHYAARDGLLACPLADAWGGAAAMDPYARDVLAMCAMSPPLDAASVRRADDGQRMRLMRIWAEQHARTPRLFAFVDGIAATPPRDRPGMLLRQIDELPSIDQRGCALADALDATPP